MSMHNQVVVKYAPPAQRTSSSAASQRIIIIIIIVVTIIITNIIIMTIITIVIIINIFIIIIKSPQSSSSTITCLLNDQAIDNALETRSLSEPAHVHGAKCSCSSTIFQRIHPANLAVLMVISELMFTSNYAEKISNTNL